MALQSRVGKGFGVAQGEWNINGGIRVSTTVGQNVLEDYGRSWGRAGAGGKGVGVVGEVENRRLSPDS